MLSPVYLRSKTERFHFKSPSHLETNPSMDKPRKNPRGYYSHGTDPVKSIDVDGPTAAYFECKP